MPTTDATSGAPDHPTRTHRIDYRIGDKLRLLAMRLDRSDHPNPFVRAWRAFWSRSTRDDEVQRDLRIWAAALDEIGGGPESDQLRTPELEQHMEALRKADVARRYRVTEIDCISQEGDGDAYRSNNRT